MSLHFLPNVPLISPALDHILLRCWRPLLSSIPSSIHLSPLVLTPFFLPCFYLLPSLCVLPCPSPICDPPSLPLSCPMAHVLDLHLWPPLTPRPDPGAEGNIFLLSLFLGFKKIKTKQKQKQQPGNELCSTEINVSRSHPLNTSRGKCCWMCMQSFSSPLCKHSYCLALRCFLKGSTLILHATSMTIHPALNDLRTRVCKTAPCCFEFWMSAAFMCTIMVQPHGIVPHDSCSFRCWRHSWGSLGWITVTTTPEKMKDPA